MLNIMDKLNDETSSFKDWVIANSSNPVVWFVLVGIVVLLFVIGFRTLKK